MKNPTPRQLEVIALISHGKKLREIAPILGISFHTTKRHMKDIFERTDTVNSSHLVATALRNGWIE